MDLHIGDLDTHFMKLAYEQALLAQELGEVPIGAVLTIDDELVATNHNSTIANNDPTAHAEILVIRDACARTGNYRLLNSKLYVTMEPCIMCLGAIVQARVGCLCYSANDTRVGVLSKLAMHSNKEINHNLDVKSGIMALDSSKLMKSFFEKKRAN